MKRYNIEFCHIYSDECLQDHHLDSIKICNEITKSLTTLDYEVVTSVLYDNYNPKRSLFSSSELVNSLETYGFKPDFLIEEQALVPYSYKFLDSLRNNRWKLYYEKKELSTGKVSCSVLVATWNLVRLGRIELQPGVLNSYNRKASSFNADVTISILPKQYETIENTALDLIKASTYADDANRIYHLYY